MTQPISAETANGTRSLLAECPQLERRLDPAHVEIARRALRVSIVTLAAGPWETDGLDRRGGIGYLITKGYVAREIDLTHARSFEPLGPGDILCPWQEDAVSFVRSRYQVIEAAEIAELTHGFVSRAARVPGVIQALFESAIHRSRCMALFGAIDGIVGIEQRLMFLFWTLAERWGEFRDQDVFLPVSFRHSAFADLIAARRPSVSTALTRLQESGEIKRVEGGWILCGVPPEPPKD